MSPSHRRQALGRFATMQLDHIERRRGPVEQGIVGIDEDADPDNMAGQAAAECQGLIGRDVTRRGREEI